MKYTDNMTPEQTAQLLAECAAQDKAYTSAADTPAERFNKDLLALVAAAQDVISQTTNDKCPEIVALADALAQFEPWLETGSEDPRANGWEDDKGRP